VREGTYLLFVWRPTGYELLERTGSPPSPGGTVDLSDESLGRFLVTKLGPSPLPEDRRPCAFLHPV
jgi:hypothetical protein